MVCQRTKYLLFNRTTINSMSLQKKMESTKKHKFVYNVVNFFIAINKTFVDSWFFFSFCKKVQALLITLPKYFRFRIIRFFWHGSLRPSHQGKTLLDPLKGVHKVSHNGMKYFFKAHSYFLWICVFASFSSIFGVSLRLIV